MFYPLFLTPFFRECIWGGENLRNKLNKNFPKKNIGESFELSCYKDYLCTISNGIFKDIHLKSLVDIYSSDILGKKITSNFFPLIIKFLDAHNRLSIQVHPKDEYALKKSLSLGKNELWYVVHANENSKVALGFKDGTTKTILETSLKEDNIESILNIENVSVGDTIFIPAGTVHALLENIIVMEVQQSSDITYRLYDWNRLENGKKRTLHVEDALNVIDFSSKGKIIKNSELNGRDFYNLINIKDFTVDYLKVTSLTTQNTRLQSFHAYTCINGSGKVRYKNLTQNISKGDTFLIPAILDEYTLLGDMELIKVYIS